MREAELIRTLDHPNIVTLSGRKEVSAYVCKLRSQTADAFQVSRGVGSVSS